ncbi:MAG: STAS domain-containing protein [Desulfocapsaceae bacterium]|nr:STAS domain-containing protein [Desulfocapsaceae bacterium]
MVGSTQNSSAGEVVIGSGKRLTIETIADFVSTVRRKLAEAETVVVEFDPDVELDITSLQAFCSACMTAAAQGKTFVYREPLPKALLDLNVAAGSVRHEQCTSKNRSCFCRGGGPE